MLLLSSLRVHAQRLCRDLRGDLRRVVLLTLLAALAMLALDRLNWSGAPGDLLSVLTFVLTTIVLLTHILRRLLLPQIRLGELQQAAARAPLAAALVFAAVLLFKAVLVIAFVLMFTMPGHASALPAGLPQHAYRNLPLLLEEQRTLWPDHPAPSVLAAQVEQETCVSLKSARCWSEYAELKTAREHGVGLGQVTRTARFDTLQELKKQYGPLLAGWSWQTPYDPRFQARALVLQDRRCYAPLRGTANPRERLAMALNCYNAGPGMLAISRNLCAANPCCDPSRWFGHVEKADGPSRRAGYGQRSFYQISREYVGNIMNTRRSRYAFLDRTPN